MKRLLIAGILAATCFSATSQATSIHLARQQFQLRLVGEHVTDNAASEGGGLIWTLGMEEGGFARTLFELAELSPDRPLGIRDVHDASNGLTAYVGQARHGLPAVVYLADGMTLCSAGSSEASCVVAGPDGLSPYLVAPQDDNTSLQLSLNLADGGGDAFDEFGMVADSSLGLPEPGMLVLFGLGLAGLGATRRWSRG